MSRIPPSTSVRARNDLKEVTVRVFEIESAPAIAMIDLTLLRLSRIGPMRQPLMANAAKDLIEL
jgi:hypothetical protein